LFTNIPCYITAWFVGRQGVPWPICEFPLSGHELSGSATPFFSRKNKVWGPALKNWGRWWQVDIGGEPAVVYRNKPTGETVIVQWRSGTALVSVKLAPPAAE
jgi:hypothetical protein